MVCGSPLVLLQQVVIRKVTLYLGSLPMRCGLLLRNTKVFNSRFRYTQLLLSPEFCPAHMIVLADQFSRFFLAASHSSLPCVRTRVP